MKQVAKKQRQRKRKPKHTDNSPTVSNIKNEINGVNTQTNQSLKRKRNHKRLVNSNGKTNNTAVTKTTLTYPKAQDSVSTNWKKMLETLETSKPEGQETMESPKSSRKRLNPNQPRNIRKQNKNDTETLLSEMNGVRYPQKRKTANSNKNTLSKSPKITEERCYASAVRNGKNEIWFDDVDPELLGIESPPTKDTTNTQKVSQSDKKENFLTKPGSFKGLTKAIGIDCEMVGVGPDGQDSILARVSLVNLMGHCVYDKFVKPLEPVTDYRTEVSGVRSSDLENAADFAVVQKEVCDLLHGRILVGHAVYNDLKVLYLGHPRSKIRDTSTYKPFRQLFGGATPALKKLAERLLGVKVQQGEHSSVQDAQAAMRLYTMYKRTWETEIKQKLSSNRKSTKKAVPISPGTNKMAQLKI